MKGSRGYQRIKAVRMLRRKRKIDELSGANINAGLDRG